MGNIKKTMRYLKRNGFANTYYAVKERLFYKDVPFNAYENSEHFLKTETDKKFEGLFSIVVPVYETKEEHLRAMIESVIAQDYKNWELVIGDASKTDLQKNIVLSYSDERIKYVRILENKGISENTNVALKESLGEFVVLLDHDDLLTGDALSENAKMIALANENGIEPTLIYSDEDKCVTGDNDFFEPHIKQKFNYDLFLSNNYICHLSVIKGELARKLGFRKEYDGAQDYDFILRIVLNSEPSQILHIAKVLYHWRCHENSTAFDPASKEYAYDAGRRAIEYFLKNKYNEDINVIELSHKGFYRPVFEDIFKSRKDVGAIGHLLTEGKRFSSGIISEDGFEHYKGMNRHYSGYFHRVHLLQDVFALDLRTVTPSEEMLSDYEELVNFVKNEITLEPREDIWKDASVEFAKRLHNKNLTFLYLPDIY